MGNNQDGLSQAGDHPPGHRQDHRYRRVPPNPGPRAGCQLHDGSETSTPFLIEVDVHRKEFLILRLTGELDSCTVPQLVQALAPVRPVVPTRLVLDLTDLTFVDSSGLQWMLSERQRLHQLGGDMMLRGARPHVLRLLDTMGLRRLFTIA